MMMSFSIITLAEQFKRCCVPVYSWNAFDWSVCVNGLCRWKKTKSCFHWQYLCNLFMFPMFMWNKRHVFACFNDMSASLLRCACIFTTNSTEGIAWPRWILGALMLSPLLTWLLWPTLKWISQVSRQSYRKRYAFRRFFFNLSSLRLYVLSTLSSVNWDTVWRANTTAKFHVCTELNRNVGLLRLFPGITAATVSSSADESCETVQHLSLVTCDMDCSKWFRQSSPPQSLVGTFQMNKWWIQ